MQLYQLVRLICSPAYNQLAALNNLQETYQLRSREVEVLTNATATAATLFNTGRATYLEVIITQSSVLQTRLSLVQVRKRQYQTMVYLYRALGGGWR
jgi:outer membrane protein TolC